MTKIDWTAPLEAYHLTDGRVVGVSLNSPGPNLSGDYQLAGSPGTDRPIGVIWANKQGCSYIGTQAGKWRIRNRTPKPTPQEQAMALVERMASGLVANTVAASEARAIVDAMKPPVDADVLVAREIIAEAMRYKENGGLLTEQQAKDGKGDEYTFTTDLVEALRRARKEGEK